MRTLKWVIIINTIYVILAITNILVVGLPMEIILLAYLIILAMPLYSRKVAKWLKLDLIWFN